MDMIASVVKSSLKELLVRDFKTNSNVIVFSPDAYRFSAGDCVRIKYDGKTTRDSPPKIIAAHIWEIECPD